MVKIHLWYIYLNFRYIFNCGEGTQRLAHEHKMKLSKLEHVFITHSNWLNIGGLPGLALTVQDVGVPNIELHGPQGIVSFFYQKYLIVSKNKTNFLQKLLMKNVSHKLLNNSLQKKV